MDPDSERCTAADRRNPFRLTSRSARGPLALSGKNANTTDLMGFLLTDLNCEPFLNLGPLTPQAVRIPKHDEEESVLVSEIAFVECLPFDPTTQST